MKPCPSLLKAAALALLLAPAPATASPADIALLKSYIGEWMGRGTANIAATGADETVVCRLGVTDADAAKVNFSGRCSLAGRTLSVAGTVAYVAATGRFEAIMSSNTRFQGIAVGERSGDALAFNLIDRNAEGEENRIDAALSFAGDTILMDFAVENLVTGAVTRAHVPFQLQG